MDSPGDIGSDVLSQLHHRYLLLSGRFKSSWTFHQFLKGVNKVFADEALELGTLSFQSIYSELKVASKNLNVASAETATHHLDRAERELERRIQALLDVDERLTPTLLRRFFKRVRNYDARILGQLLKFYLFTREANWNDDRLDKADYLLTRLGELLLERDLDPLERQPNALRDALRGIWQVVGEETPSDAEVTMAAQQLDQLRGAMAKIETLEDFHQMGVIRSYRDFKKGLESLFFHPGVALHIVETNLFLAERVDSLYAQEERRVAVEYNKVFDLERDVPQLEDTLDRELRSFRSKVEDLEASAKGQNVKIDQIVGVSESARELIPRLEGFGRGTVPAADSSAAEDSDAARGSKEDAPDANGGLSEAAAEPEHDAAWGDAAHGDPGLEPLVHSDDDVGDLAAEQETDEDAADGEPVDGATEAADSGQNQADSTAQQAEAPDPEDASASGTMPDDEPADESAYEADTETELEESAPLQASPLGPLPDFFGAPLGTSAAAQQLPAPAVSDQPHAPGDDAEAQASDSARTEREPDWRADLSAERPMETLRIRTAYADQLGEVLRQVLQVLEGTDWQQSPKLVVQVPEVRGLRLEPREVLAYRRLFFPERFDRQLEQFLVEAASLRVLMGHQAEELADYVESASGEADTEALKVAALSTVALASEFEKRCQHFVQEAVHARDTADAASLQVIWMRLLREYSGLWLLLHR